MDAVAAAFEACPREDYLPPHERWRASYDGPIQIAGGQTNSQPRTVEAMLRLLDVGPGQRVLDVGSGSGWTTALLAELVGADGEVLGVELAPELVVFGRENLARSRHPWARIEPADPDVLGCPEGAPWDRILVSAEPRKLPNELVEQLAEDGVLVIPVAGTMLRVTNPGAVVTRHGAYRFVPLR